MIPEKEFRDTLRDFPVICVDAVITSSDKVLLIKRDIEPFKGFWHLPGGFLHKGELLREAAIREAKEETGLDISLVRRAQTIFEERDSIPDRHAVIFAYLATAIGGQLHGSPEGHELDYFSIDDLPKPFIPLIVDEIRASLKY